MAWNCRPRTAAMMFSSVKLAMRRCFIPGRARRCFLVILAISLTSLWMLTMQVIQPRPQTNLPDSKNFPDLSISRTKSPKTRGVRLADDKHAGSPMDSVPEFEKEGTKLHQQRLLKGEPVYQMAERHIKDTEGLVLFFIESYDSGGRTLLNILSSHRFTVKVALVHDNTWPSLTRDGKGLFSVIIFESLRSYGHLSSVKTKVLQDYCRSFNVGIIIFTQPEVSSDFSQIRNFPLYIEQHARLKDPIVNQTSNVPRITRSNLRFFGNLPGDRWTTFSTNHSTYVPVMEAISAVPPQVVSRPEDRPKLNSKICVVYDRGWMDGIKRIFFGHSASHFLHMLLVLDSISHLTDGKLQTDLDRYILIDIDDIFVGKTGIRLKVSDVENMVKVQEELEDLVKGFRFNLGYSGKYYQHGDEEENAGDLKLLEEAKHFWWFPHMWDHMQPHNIKTRAKLKDLMLLNKKFAVDNGIPIMQGYSVAPHHSGVYPVHEDLYDLWKEVWGIDATSTEEYPHLRPAHRRRGFIYKDIMVLPRQTCSLFTKTNYFSEYNGGKSALDANIQGGELFATLVSNPVNVFMTHMSNYGSDRLATYTFTHLFQFVRTYTNLKLQTLPPVPTAKKYFELYPQEKLPLWGNPCDDHRLMEVWAENKDCSRLPNSLILGPQKTGTTALYTFLHMHKGIVSNRPSEKTFEEVQFFNGENYYNGLDWYLDFFPSSKNQSHVHIFEKSANYFDSVQAPKRVKALLPKAKLIVILLDPAKRAYSWYQHMRAHNDETSLQFSFSEVINAKPDAPKAVRDLQKRCLEPGKYATHLQRWLQHFPSRQMFLLDGDLLKTNPALAMLRVQKFLKIKPALNYSRLLKYDAQKGFYCPVGPKNRTHCLGKGKGRKYPDMDDESTEILKAYYRQDNLILSSVLEKLNQPLPDWLSDHLNDF